MDKETFDKLREYLNSFLTEERKERIDFVINNRTNHITLVVEDLMTPHNASAIMRSCDCFGVQKMHAIEGKYEFVMDKEIAAGSSKWVDIDIHRHETDGTKKTLRSLKEQGYKIVATTPHTDDCTPEKLDLSQPIALVFGTERDGISDDVREEADEFLRIPMYGFTESFNISVSAALILNTLNARLHDSDIPWQLTQEQKDELNYRFAKNTIREADLIEKDFLKKLENGEV